MSILRIVLAALLFAAQARAPIRLPADPNAAVIVMDRIGGFRSIRRNASPFLTVRVDGTVTAVDTDFPDKIFTAQLTVAELQDLLGFVIEDQSFFQFNASDVQKQIDADRIITIYDLSTALIRVTTAERSYEGSFNGPVQWSRSYPSIRALSQLAAVDTRLMHLYEEVKAGWKDGIEAVIKLVNENLKRDPSLPTLARGDYQQTLYSPRVDNQRTVYFERNLDGRLLSVSVMYPPNAEPQVTVRLAGTLLPLTPR